MSSVMGSRCYRLLVVALLVFIVWQVVSYFWLQRGVDQLSDTVQLTGRRVPDKHFSYDTVLAVDKPVVVEVKVFYEALCPDSMRFVVDQLTPAVHSLSDAILVTLVPYGKATTQYYSRPNRRAGDPPPVTFSCQHGPEECWANKVHACGIRQADSQAQAIDFVTCLLKHYHKMRANAEECARSVGMQWNQLAVCAEDEAINTDMERYGNMTMAVKPSIFFIPTITVDGSQSHQGDIFSNSLKFFCKAYEDRAGTMAKGC